MRTNRGFLMVIVCVGMLCACKESTKWAQYTSKEGGFTVFMPSNPAKMDKKVGKQLIHFVTWRPATFALDKFKLVEVSYYDVPGGVSSDTSALNALLDSGINNRKKDFTENDLVSHPISLNGYPGRAFMYQASRGNTIAIVKECIVGNRRYDLTVIAKKDYPTNNEINSFFNSFTALRQ